MTTQTTKIRNGKISFTLPQKLQRAWRGAEVFVFSTENSLLVKKIEKPKNIFNEETGKKLQSLGKRITKKDIEEAISWVRGKEK